MRTVAAEGTGLPRARVSVASALIAALLLAGSLGALREAQAASPAAPAASTRPAAAPQVRYIREWWLDEARQRHVQVRIALPPKAAGATAQAPMPVLLFSTPQGWRWGGYAEHYRELSAEMLRRGVVTVTVSHPDLDEPMGANERWADVYPGVLTGKRNDAPVDRFEDWGFVLRRLQAMAAQKAGDWPALDFERLAVGGHSSGTWTALHLVGMPVRDREGRVFATQRDARIKAFLLFSAPLEHQGPSREDLSRIGPVPGLHVAGHQDFPEYRQAAYRYAHRAPQVWLVAEGGHNVGAGGSDTLVLEVAGAFVDLYLNGRTEARERLSYESLESFKPALRQFSSKPALAVKPPDQRDFVAWARDHLPGARWLHERAMAQARSREAAAR